MAHRPAVALAPVIERMHALHRFLVLLVAVLVGCADNRQPRSLQTGDDLRRYASLPGLQTTHHVELRAELDRLISERATPELLSAKTSRAKTDPFSIRSTRLNGREELARILPDSMLRQLYLDIERRYPAGEFRFNLRQLEGVEQTLARYAEPLEKFRELLETPELEFPIDHRLGLAIATDWIDAIQALVRLESLAIAVQIEHGKLPQAVRAITPLFGAATALAEIEHLVPRLTAVHMRHELLAVMMAICEHPEVNQDIYERLHQLVSNQLQQWPPDSLAWIGERADGLHTYELIRDGFLLSVLSFRELQQFRDEIGIKRLGELVAKNINHDECFYLSAMREAIDSCSQPFYARRSVLKKLDQDLELARDGDQYPIIADHVMLPDLDAGMRLQALDRVRLEAWQLALSLARRETAETRENSLTGTLFVIDIQPSFVVVDGIDPEDAESAIRLALPPETNVPVSVTTP